MSVYSSEYGHLYGGRSKTGASLVDVTPSAYGDYGIPRHRGERNTKALKAKSQASNHELLNVYVNKQENLLRVYE